MIRKVINKLRKKTLGHIFHELMYNNDLWKVSGTISGPGSTIENTQSIRKEIPELLKRLEIKSVLDAPCGDLNWMSQLELNEINYVGVDIVKRLIKENKLKYPGKIFIVADITKDNLPYTDLVICRDCFIHLSNNQIKAAIKNFRKSGTKYLLTNSYNFIDSNVDISPGDFRMINLKLSPFSLPEPEYVISEDYTSGYPDKYLGLWKINNED